MRATVARFLILLGTFAPCGQAAGQDLLFPGERGPLRLRLEVRIDGQAPDAAWGAFLDKLFDYFDRDADGSLRAAEAARAFPLPLAGGREAAPDFKQLDADRDGKGSRAELKAFCRRAGFTPAVVTVRPPAAEDLLLSEALFLHLDRDGDGKLTEAELKNAAAVLRRFDQDEDDVLTAAELLSPPPEGEVHKPERSAVEAAAPDGATPDAVLRVVLGKEQPQPSLTGARDKAIQAVADRPGAPFRLRTANGFCTVVSTPDANGASFRSARSFYLAQLKAALGDRPSAEKKHLEQDPASQGLVGLFEYADWDGDGRLTLSELEAFLTLVGHGVVCQTVVTVTDRGRDLFAGLDQDRDGRLDLRELNAAFGVLSGDTNRPALTRDRVPRQCQLVVERGTPSTSFGAVSLSGRVKQPEVGPPSSPRGPRWFRAMDRNGDGVLSPREFLGSPELFRRVDADGDGLLSAEEAERADAKATRRPEDR